MVSVSQPPQQAPVATSSPDSAEPRFNPGPWPIHGAATGLTTRAWPLHEREAAQAVEAAALAQTPPFSLMAQAGRSVARLARALAPHAQRVLVLAGPGHNGGDGLVAARWLHRAGLQVQVLLSTAPEHLPADAARAWREAQVQGVSVSVMVDGDPAPRAGTAGPPAPGAAPDLLVDALLGLGARRAPAGTVNAAIALGRAWAARGVPVLAIDLPSGLHPDSGQPLGTLEQVLPATATLCLLTLRPACFTGRGRDLAGRVWFDDLACPAPPASATAWLCGPVARPLPPHAAHKGSQGDVALVGGAPGMAGAAWLAAGAALAAGAGRVFLSLLDEAAIGLNPCRPELMTRARLWAASPDWLHQRTVVAGCGGGQDIAGALHPLLSHAGRLLLDADALNAIAADSDLATQLQQRAQMGLPTVLTPHPLEAARLLGQDTAAVQADRLGAARTLAQRFGAVVVLKGSGTVVAAPGGQDITQPGINPSGNASLATAGTGDVLAGWLGGLWARHGAVRSLGELQALVQGGVWQHGAAADGHRAAGHAGPLMAAALVAALADARLP